MVIMGGFSPHSVTTLGDFLFGCANGWQVSRLKGRICLELTKIGCMYLIYHNLTQDWQTSLQPHFIVVLLRGEAVAMYISVGVYH